MSNSVELSAPALHLRDNRDRRMDLRLLGPVEVTERDRPLALGGVKQRSVLAILLLHANQVVSADRLIDQPWSDHTPPSLHLSAAGR
jgi:hypothetical protein